ncbi:Arylsulfatase precursor [Posidoniimonas corsicana]|uniref:Arylsulfatase n=1 Tax=Posidoniimonas corsicana TaxID=1938618 RepID=A0A5C5VFG5_9BACT|nr:arylsulfatase [Posidoniimonas corsicana]TWT36610.1 Arylsulfatase precursor [Posidoniimonas corsicana]
MNLIHGSPVAVFCLTACFAWLNDASSADLAQRPSVVLILADDLGYGDVQCLNPERGKIATPNLDQLAQQGMTFTDAHTASSVCTPTRYALLTGRYNWRTRLQSGVLWGYSAPLIAEGRLTIAELMKQNGYRTACFGKWHLGMDLPTTGGPAPTVRKPKIVNIDWKGAIQNGPTDVGFDAFYGITASLDMAPYIYIQDDRFVGECEGGKGKSAMVRQHDFNTRDVLPEIGRKATEYISSQDGKQPFFVYVPLTSPHTPIVPSAEWVGKSGLGKYGDFVMQTDDVIGKILDAVDARGLSKNTLVIVTSDNGCSNAAKIPELQAKGHYPSAHLRGSKADLWDGGHRVPFFVRWPGVVEEGSRCDQTICQTDLIATCAEILGKELPENAGEDSVSFLPAFSGQTIRSSRAGIVHHSISGHFGYRQGNWKLLLARGSGGWTSPNEKAAAKAGAPFVQLYDMENDPGESDNLSSSHPEVVERLLAQLESDVARGRSTDGMASRNDVATIKLWKSGEE